MLVEIPFGFIIFNQIKHIGYYCIYQWDKNCFCYVWNMWSQPTCTGSAKKMYTHFNERKLYVVC